MTPVEALGPGAPDEVLLADAAGCLTPAPPTFRRRVTDHLERLRRRAGDPAGLRVATRNSFPAAAGMASSASGFAALTLAAAGALDLSLSPEERSDLARRSGSGSAARSVFGGYVEWPGRFPEEGEADPAVPAVPLAPAEHWDLADVVAVLEEGPKEVSSLDGHRRATTSPYFERRLELLPGRLAAVREALRRRDFDALAPVLEEEAVDLHLIAMSSRPPIFYWSPATLAVLARVRELRTRGVRAACTMDAGANVHVLCPAAEEAAVVEALEALPAVLAVIRDRVGPGPAVRDDHLF
jgi:diphosphomevalonate decarboxylase